jgi:hypothetical protein
VPPLLENKKSKEKKNEKLSKSIQNREEEEKKLNRSDNFCFIAGPLLFHLSDWHFSSSSSSSSFSFLSVSPVKQTHVSSFAVESPG